MLANAPKGRVPPRRDAPLEGLKLALKGSGFSQPFGHLQPSGF
jgi:hypothetical protein